MSNVSKLSKPKETKPKENTFECSICCTESNESSRFRKLECPSCSYTVCSTCQKTYGQLDCMNCHIVFRNSFAISVLGTTFVTKTVKQNKLNELMLHQREELKSIGPLVEWTKNMRIIEKQEKYGIVINLSEEDRVKPGRISATVTFPCFSNNCRGYITRCSEENTNKGRCSLCKTGACMICQEAYHEGNCDENVLETMKDIRNTTKPCPKCSIPIHKTQGCDHMHCTKCNTHFNYNTGTIIHNSSNYHYRNALIRENNLTDVQDECRVSDEEPRIPEDIIRRKIENIHNCLLQSNQFMTENIKTKISILLDGFYNVPKAVRSLLQNEYRLQRIATFVRERYDELQIKFAMNEISEKLWEQQVYKTYIKQLVSELISNIMYIYLANVDGFQSEFYEYNFTNMTELETFIDDLMNRFDRLIDIANDSISEIRMDYEPTSSNQIMIRKLGESDKSYCTKQEIRKIEKKERMIPELKPDMSLTPILSYDYQIPHINQLESILIKMHFAIDLSPLGTGKTYTAAKIFQNNPNYKHLLTISPLSVKTKWNEVNETYGLNIIANLTYNEMGGKRGVNPKNGLLTRNDYKIEVYDEDSGTMRMLDKYIFTPTDYLLKLIEDGLFVVIDEFQHLKNESAQTEACKTIICAVMDHFNRVQIQNPNKIHESMPLKNAPQTRVLLMSGSPIDHSDQVARLFKTLGIMRNPRIVSGYKHAGLNEVIEFLETKFPGNYYLENTINMASTYMHGRGYIQNSNTAKYYMYRWFLNIIKPELSSTMDACKILNSKYKLEKFNGYFQTTNAYLQSKINNAVKELENVATQMKSMRIRLKLSNRRGESATVHQEMMRRITLHMIEIETAKIHTFELLARKHLNDAEFPNKKVVIALNYTDTLNELETLLADYHPLILNGSKNFNQRKKILKAFQSPTNENRLLIGNFAVMSTGIDLDDKHGDFPRVCLASPNCNTISIYQLGHRFMRGRETKSNSQIYMVYGISKSEQNITELLMRKGSIMKEVLSEQSDSGMVFPCDYTPYHETLDTISESTA